jgi:hypothetical protein
VVRCVRLSPSSLRSLHDHQELSFEHRDTLRRGEIHGEWFVVCACRLLHCDLCTTTRSCPLSTTRGGFTESGSLCAPAAFFTAIFARPPGSTRFVLSATIEMQVDFCSLVCAFITSSITIACCCLTVHEWKSGIVSVCMTCFACETNPACVFVVVVACMGGDAWPFLSRCCGAFLLLFPGCALDTLWHGRLCFCCCCCFCFHTCVCISGVLPTSSVFVVVEAPPFVSRAVRMLSLWMSTSSSALGSSVLTCVSGEIAFERAWRVPFSPTLHIRTRSPVRYGHMPGSLSQRMLLLPGNLGRCCVPLSSAGDDDAADDCRCCALALHQLPPSACLCCL